MARPTLSHTLSVWMNGEIVGHWRAAPREAHQFTYADSWLHSQAVRPLSLSLPVGPQGTVHTGAAVEHFFDNLLPDNRLIRDRLRQKFAASTGSSFDLLARIGRDCIGAVQLLPEGETPADVRRIDGTPLDEAGIERALDSALTGTAAGDEEDDFRISLAGAQEKTALLCVDGRWMRPSGSTPTTHILKLPLGVVPQGVDLSQSVENEWLCGRILRAYGVPVAESRIEHFGTHKVLVVERFDRRFARDGRWIARLPQEDFCQATATSREHKYEADGGPGIRRIMDVLLGSSRAEDDRLDFFRTQLLFWMLCAIDGHAKNFSLFLEAQGRYHLTPRYDVLSALPVLGTKAGRYSPHKVKMAMAVHGERSRHYLWNEILRRHWVQTARLCGIGAKVEHVIAELVGRTAGVVLEVGRALPANFPVAVAEPMLEGLTESARKLTLD